MPTVLGGAGARGGAATSRWQRALPRASPLCPLPAAATGLLRGSWILDAALHGGEPGLLGKRLVPGWRHNKSAICSSRWEMVLEEQSGHDRRAQELPEGSSTGQIWEYWGIKIDPNTPQPMK